MIRLLKDRRFIYAAAAVTAFIILAVLGMRLLLSEKKELQILKDQRKEMVVLKDEYISLKQKIDAVEGKKNVPGIQGIIQAVDEIFLSTGLKDKVKTVKSAGKRETRDGFEEEADVFIEKVTMNEMVNIFYRIDNAPMVMTIKKATIKKSFENPELLNISLVLSFLKAK